MPDSYKPSFICPKNCAGRGKCDYSKAIPTCICNDLQDSSPFCVNSPRSTVYHPFLNETISSMNSTVLPSNSMPWLSPSPNSVQSYSNTTSTPTNTPIASENTEMDGTPSKDLNRTDYSGVIPVFDKFLFSCGFCVGVSLSFFYS